MENKNTVIEAKIGNLNELTKVLSVKEQAQEQLLVVMKVLGIGKIVRNLKFEKAQGYTLASLFISLLIMRLWGKTIASATSNVSIRPTTGIKPLYTTIATVTMNLIVSAAIVLLNPYVTIYISYKIPPFALSVHIPDVSTSIYVEVDSKVLLGLPFCDKAFVR